LEAGVPQCPRQGVADVLPLVAVEVASGCHVKRDGALQGLLRERCGPDGVGTEG
jgi:hypothetical protein